MNSVKNFFSSYGFPNQFISLFDIWYTKAVTLISGIIYKPFLKILGMKWGRNLSLIGLPIIRMRKRGDIICGINVCLRSAARTNLVGMVGKTILDTKMGGCIQIGDNTGVSSTIISSRACITIGKNVKIGANVKIIDHDFHSLDFEQRQNVFLDNKNVLSHPIRIGNDVFIGANAIILKGVVIGDRAVIGTNSIVTKNVGSDQIWGGNPAKLLKKINNNL